MTLLQSLLALVFAALILTVTRGVDTAMILRTAAVGGTRRAWFAALGIGLGCLIWGGAVSLGLGALLAASDLAYDAEMGGNGVSALAGDRLILWPRRGIPLAEEAGRDGWTAMRRGLLTNLLNPNRRVLRDLPAAVRAHGGEHRGVFVPAGGGACRIIGAVVRAADRRDGAAGAGGDRDGPADRGIFVAFGVKLALTQ